MCFKYCGQVYCSLQLWHQTFGWYHYYNFHYYECKGQLKPYIVMVSPNWLNLWKSNTIFYKNIFRLINRVSYRLLAINYFASLGIFMHQGWRTLVTKSLWWSSSNLNKIFKLVLNCCSCFEICLLLSEQTKNLFCK